MVIEEELRAIVGADHVSSDVLRLKAYGVGQDRAAPGKFCYIVQPETAKEIQSIVRLANNHKLPVTPYSSGIHFFNSTAPFETGIILELGRMKRILAIDERNRMVRIEPGVIWGQLQSELQNYDLLAVSPLLPHPLK
ncbi:MAG TPA: FAD-dependent oxidoreductase, partial [Dehalococcoidia bacterium]|nr:FAD-dependent oxidoreductase [Dehalococcoidia bacterium]